jgi:hypothetical protein
MANRYFIKECNPNYKEHWVMTLEKMPDDVDNMVTVTVKGSRGGLKARFPVNFAELKTAVDNLLVVRGKE